MQKKKEGGQVSVGWEMRRTAVTVRVEEYILLYVGAVECAGDDLMGALIDEDTAHGHFLVGQRKPGLSTGRRSA